MINFLIAWNIYPEHFSSYGLFSGQVYGYTKSIYMDLANASYVLNPFLHITNKNCDARIQMGRSIVDGNVTGMDFLCRSEVEILKTPRAPFV